VKQTQIRQEHKERIYRLIETYHREKNWPIRTMCEILRVSRAAYYKWLDRKDAQPCPEDALIEEKIRQVAQSNNRLFGVRKMRMVLNKELENSIGFKKVYRLMSKMNLLSVYRPKRKRYGKSSPEYAPENILNRQFNAEKPNDKWVTDITEIKIPGSAQKLYISTIMDLYDRSIVACEMSTRNDTDLVNETLRKALEANPEGCRLFHSDRGFQYTREVFGSKLKTLGITQSMSRVSRCIDNGCEEGVQGILKDMYRILYPKVRSIEEAKEAFRNTVDYYMNQYPQERFNGKTAAEVRAEALQTEQPVQYPIKSNPRIEKFWERVGKSKKSTSIA
jgi:transposase InsO family protein